MLPRDIQPIMRGAKPLTGPWYLLLSFIIIFSFHTGYVFGEDDSHLPVSEKYQSDPIGHTGYYLQYSEKREQALWVAYELTRREVRNKRARRSDNFRSDPSIHTGSATLSDYKDSGYDRGHLVPAADLAWSSMSMSDSFYLSNMSPQVPGFNRGIWKKLESKVRDWAVHYKVVYVVTGSLYLEQNGAIGVSHVDIPSHYYKVLLVESTSQPRMIAFLLPNEKSNSKLKNFVVAVDEVEKLGEFDFFSELPDGEEKRLESSKNIEDWKWDHQITVLKDASVRRAEINIDQSRIYRYWLSGSSNKRHNVNCRWYKKSAGKMVSVNEGVACSACGG